MDFLFARARARAVSVKFAYRKLNTKKLPICSIIWDGTYIFGILCNQKLTVFTGMISFINIREENFRVIPFCFDWLHHYIHV